MADRAAGEARSAEPADAAVRYGELIAASLAQHQAVMVRALSDLRAESTLLGRAAALIVDALRSEHTILLVGNGGSAAEAQHFAAELVGRFRRERRPYAALALTTDTSILTAVANDYSYEEVFSRQVLAIGRPGDVLLAFSTSGRSPNLIRAATAAHERGMRVVAVTGQQESPLSEAADLTIRAPAAETPIVQELHTVVTHLLCDLAEVELIRLDAGEGR
jgi:D-sedoheptulose 7-phosphate isomerase